MAINDIVQTIAEARVDARSLSEFVFKPAGFKVARRLAPTVDTLQFYINRFNSLNGDFSSSVSAAQSSLNNSVAEAQGKVAYIESTVQDAINNTAVEGGILADTFVTVTPFNGAEARTQRDVNQELLESSRLLKASEYLFKPSNLTDHSDELQDTIDYCAANNLKAKPIGVFKINKKIVIKGAFDGGRATLHVMTAVPIALEISTGEGENPISIVRLTTEESIILPDVINKAKSSVGWENQGIGVRYVNVHNTKITERLVENFAIGVQHTSYDQGCGYNTVQAGYLRNNKVNRQFVSPTLTGFTNRWDLFGGRYFHSSAEGIEVEGVMHFDVVPSPTGNIINDINHFGGSFEGLSEQYHIRLGGTHINFWGIRLETKAIHGGMKIHLASAGMDGQGSGNGFHAGRGVAFGEFYAVHVTQDELVGDARFELNSTYATSYKSTAGTVQVYRSTSGSATPVLAVMSSTSELATPVETGYEAALSAHKLAGKRQSDTADRLDLNFVNGTITLGDGINPSNLSIVKRGGSSLGTTANWIPNTKDTYSLGIAGFEWQAVYSAKYMFTATVGAFYGAGTPEGVVAAGVGSTYHCTDGAAGTCFYVKETGVGKTGWVAK